MGEAMFTQSLDPLGNVALTFLVALIPVVLLLGSDAVHLADLDNQARIETDRKWRELSLSTDFEGAGGSVDLPWEKH